MTKDFRKGIMSNFASKVLVAGMGLLTVVLVSRTFGEKGRGDISLFLSSVALLQLFCDYGNNSSIINLSYTHNRKNLYLSSVLWVLSVCLLAMLVLPFFSDFNYLLLIPAGAFVLSLVNLNHLMLMGDRKVHQRNLGLLIQPMVLLLVLMVAVLLGQASEDTYISGFFIGACLSFGLTFYLIRSLLNGHSFQFEPQLLKNGFWVQSGQAVQFLNYRLSFFLVNAFVGREALGVFNNAVILAESVWIAGHSIGQMQHMKILNTHDVREKLKLTDQLIGVNLLVTIAMVIVLLWIPASFWSSLFKGFEGIRELLFYLSPGVMVFSVSNIINHHLHAENKFKAILLCNLIGLLAGFAASLVLIPSNGIEGAAISWSLGLLASLISYLIVYNSVRKKAIMA